MWRNVLVVFAALIIGNRPLMSGLTREGVDAFSEMRRQMVETQIQRRGIKDERVLNAMLKVPRHEFVPTVEKLLAYTDGPLPIGHGQTISQPYIVALMTELLHLEPRDKVFEVGTGSGYQAAVLAELAEEVYTIEILEPLYQHAKTTLEKLGYRNIHTRFGDGTKGWPEAAPFDKMIVTAAGIKVPEALVDQLKEGGRIVMPVGEEEQVLVVGEKRKGILQTHETIPVRFVPLVEEEK
ncbi:MAG: protein-L-isoaspartate(D-aspartate) O-methyltransferase [Candidatus Omnitrophica bacterium]|nr:protein-L-isoaspartate(D-aspartate) O-methyltransferase [Candidatus Omnitrophota bacterium]